MGRGVLWGLVVALGTPAVAWGCSPITDASVIPLLDIGLPREIPVSGSLLLGDGDLGWLGRLLAPDGSEVSWDQELVAGEPRRLRPVGGWLIGEYEVLDFDGESLGPAYRIVDIEDDEPPEFEVTGWSGRSPGRFPAFDTCGGYTQDRAVRVEHDGPDEPVFWLWETREDGEVLEAGFLRGTVEIPAPARAVDIHLTALDTSGNRTTHIIEGAVGCGGCSGSQGPTAPLVLGLLTFLGGLLMRRARIQAPSQTTRSPRFGVLLATVLAGAMPATAFSCIYLEPYFLIPYPRDEQVEHLALDSAIYVDGEYLDAIADIRTPDGTPVAWEYAALDDAPVFAATPVDGWEVGEYFLWESDAPVGPVYEVRNAIDPTPPRFEIRGWRGLSPTDRPRTSCGSDTEGAVLLDVDRPSEPVLWLWEVWDDGELVDAGHDKALGTIPAPDHAVDIHLTAIDTAGNRTTQVIEGTVGCTGCTGSHAPSGPALASLLSLLAGLALRRRRAPASA